MSLGGFVDSGARVCLDSVDEACDLVVDFDVLVAPPFERVRAMVPRVQKVQLKELDGPVCLRCMQQLRCAPEESD